MCVDRSVYEKTSCGVVHFKHIKMKKYTIITFFIVCCTLNVEGGWKFWKKATTTTSTTVSTTTSTKTSTTVSPILNPTETGVGNLGQQNSPVTANIGKIQTPNSDTHLGHDSSSTKTDKPGNNSNNNQQYRDWAIEIAGAGEPGQIPAQNSNNRNTTNAPNQQNLPRVVSTTPKLPITSVHSISTSSKPKDNSNLQSSTHRTLITDPPLKSSEIQQVLATTTPKLPATPTHSVSTSLTPKANIQSKIERPLTELQSKVYSSNPTYSKGNSVTDEDLEKLAEALFIKDKNNANKYITLNLQKKTTSSSATDEAPQPFLQVNDQAFQIPTVQSVRTLFDNYNIHTNINEHIGRDQREEESRLTDIFLSTNVMSTAMRFLADKGFVKKDYYEYKDLLRILWFNLFSRGEGKIGSCGFEHVFMAEMKGTEVIGLHNWIYLNYEETKNRINYLGYMKKVDLGNKASIVKIHLKYNEAIKPSTTMFIGTSPELEMALYTVCFMTRPDQPCPVSLGGTKFNIITHKFKYRGKDVVGTAYPEI